jgi:hypothetical protein
LLLLSCLSVVALGGGVLNLIVAELIALQIIPAKIVMSVCVDTTVEYVHIICREYLQSIYRVSIEYL